MKTKIQITRQGFLGSFVDTKEQREIWRELPACNALLAVAGRLLLFSAGKKKKSNLITREKGGNIKLHIPMEREPNRLFKRENFATDIEAAEANFKVLMGSEAFNDEYHGYHVAMSYEDKKPVFYHENLDKLREMVDESSDKESLFIGSVGTEEEREFILQDPVLSGVGE